MFVIWKSFFCVILLMLPSFFYAQGQIQPSTPEGVAQRTPADTELYDPRPLLPGFELRGSGIPSYADKRFVTRVSPFSGEREFLIRNINDGFIFVKGSQFVMGGNEGDLTSGPHRVRLADYWISPYEVYWKLWDDVFRWAVQHGYRFLSAGSSMDLGEFDRLDKPIALVSWYDAIVWLNAYSELRNLQPVYYVNSTVYRYVLRSAVETAVLDKLYVHWNANGYRLPTEAEWEFAARGGVKGRATLYSGSNNVYDVGWFGENTREVPRLQPSGTLYPNALGLYDMSGNVAEWCWDWYASDYYALSPGVNPLGPGSGKKRVVRGGSWQDKQDKLLVSDRQAFYPKTFDLRIGFRAVRNAFFVPESRKVNVQGKDKAVSSSNEEEQKVLLEKNKQGTASTQFTDTQLAEPTQNAKKDTEKKDYVYSLYSEDIEAVENDQVFRQ